VADVVKVQDLFTDLALNVSLNGRFPTVSDGGYAWQVDGNGTALGDGAGNVKFSSSGTIKIRTLQENPVAVRTIFNDGGQAEGFVLYVGDNQGAVYPRYGYGAKFERAAGLVKMYRFDEFNAIKIGSDIAYTFPAGDFTAVFQRSGNNFYASVNGTEVGTFTDATYAPNGVRSRHGLIPTPWVNGVGRMRSYEVLDSVTNAPVGTPPHDVVRVW
jgi:hypothetical protein